MARLVELIDSIRPTVRRVIKTLAIPARANIKTLAQHGRSFYFLRKLIDVIYFLSNQQMGPIRKRFKRRS